MDPSFVVSLSIAADHPAFDGHFPGRPLLPGVALLAEAMEAAAAEPVLARAIGPRPQLSAVKFLAPVLPGARLEIAFRLGERAVAFSLGEAGEGGRVAASGQFLRADAAVPSR